MKSLFYTAWEALTLGLAAHGRAYGHMPMVEVGAAGPASTSSKPVSLPPEKDSTRRGVAAARTGRALGWLVTSILLADGASNLWFPGLTAREMIADGFPSNLSTPLGLIILTCAAVFALPRTRVIGAILVTGFLGGAICTHFRLGDLGSPPQWVALAIGFAAWASLYLQDASSAALLRLPCFLPAAGAHHSH